MKFDPINQSDDELIRTILTFVFILFGIRGLMLVKQHFLSNVKPSRARRKYERT